MAIPLEPPKIVLDDYNTLIENALSRLEYETNGAFTDRSRAGSVWPFVSMLAYAGAELLYAANKAAPLTAYSFINKVAQITRGQGTKARCSLQFSLEDTLERVGDYTIPAGFQVFGNWNGRSYRFYTDDNLVLTTEESVGIVTATAEDVGEEYNNIPPGVIINWSQLLAGLEEVRNIDTTLGGSGLESEDAFVLRLQRSIRNKNLISALDYEEAVIDILGEGARGLAIGRLSGDTLNQDERGSVHLFVLDAQGVEANAAQLSSLQISLNALLPVGTKLYISPMDTYDINVEVWVKLLPSDDYSIVAKDLDSAFRQFLNPKTYTIGKGVIHQALMGKLSAVQGVEYVETLSINGAYSSFNAPYKWSVPNPINFTLNMTLSDGTQIDPLNYTPETYVYEVY